MRAPRQGRRSFGKALAEVAGNSAGGGEVCSDSRRARSDAPYLRAPQHSWQEPSTVKAPIGEEGVVVQVGAFAAGRNCDGGVLGPGSHVGGRVDGVGPAGGGGLQPEPNALIGATCGE